MTSPFCDTIKGKNRNEKLLLLQVSHGLQGEKACQVEEIKRTKGTVTRVLDLMQSVVGNEI